MNERFVRVLAAIVAVVTIVLFILFVLGYVSVALFWTIIVIAAIIAYVIIPRIKDSK